MGIFEVHRMREEDADLVLAHADERTLRQHKGKCGDANRSVMRPALPQAHFTRGKPAKILRSKRTRDQRTRNDQRKRARLCKISHLTRLSAALARWRSRHRLCPCKP